MSILNGSFPDPPSVRQLPRHNLAVPQHIRPRNSLGLRLIPARRPIPRNADREPPGQVLPLRELQWLTAPARVPACPVQGI